MNIKKWILVGSLVLALAMTMTGTVAYLSDTDEDVNVMVLGNVDIEQIELQRADGVKHNAGEAGKGNGVKEGDLVAYVNGQPLYPAYYTDDTAYTAEATDLFFWGDYVYSGTAGNGLWNDEKLKGAMDKFVFVKNTGKSDAYFRTIIAFECPDGMAYSQGSDKEFMMNTNGSTVYEWETIGYAEIEDVRYLIMCATYQKALKPGDQSHPSLLQVVMTHNATNEHMEKLGDTYEILTLTQAVQTVNMPEDAKTALDAAFGAPSEEKVEEWFAGLKIPELSTLGGVNLLSDGETVTAIPGTTTILLRGILSEGNAKASNIVIGEGFTRLNNRSLCKDTNLKTVSLPSTLTYIDEGVFQQSGFTSIEVPENVTYIGKTAFGACADLETIIIKAKNVTFANYVARACANLKEVYIYSDSVTFESGSMYFTNLESGDASGITFYVSNQTVADALYASFGSAQHYGLLIKSIDGATTYYNTLK